MRKDIINIVGEIVADIDKTVKVGKTYFPENREFRMDVCSLKWLKIGSVILDNQNRPSTVTQIGENYIVVHKDDPFVWTSKYFTIVQDIYYFKGSPLATNQEWKFFEKDETDKVPFVWLVSPTTEVFYNNGQANERESDLRLFFLDITSPTYTVQQHHDNVIKYLNAWIDAFLEVINKNRRDFGRFDSYTLKEISRFGVETPQGVENNIIDSNLSAIELRFTLPIKKSAKCLC